MRARPGLGGVAELLAVAARQHPERTAYVFLHDGEEEAARLTWGELDRLSGAVAAALHALGARGQRVLLACPPGPDFVVGFFGCLSAGAVAVPARPPGPRRAGGLTAIARDCRPAAVLTTGVVARRLEALAAEEPALAAAARLDLDRLDTLGAAESPSAGGWRPAPVEPGAPALLQYTSGSTGDPRGVIVSHRNLLHNEESIRRVFGQSAASRVVGWLPMFHDMGLIGNLLQPLYLGAGAVLLSPAAFLRRPGRWLEAISRYRATTSGGPDFAYDLCVRRIPPEARRGLDLSCWTVAFSGAEPVRAETLERFAEAFAPCGFRPQAFLSCYGLAEATLLVAGGARDGAPAIREVDAAALEGGRVTPARGGRSRRLVSCGGAPREVEVAVVEPETGRPCEDGRVGEIWVSAPSVAGGYWHRPGETAETFGAVTAAGRGPYLRTGDLGFLAGGELYVTGRLKDLIIIRGTNHYPQDVERTAEQSHPALRPGGGAAFSVEREGGEVLVLAHELERRETDPPVAAIAAAVERAVAEEHELAVSELVLLPPGGLPRTSSGKVRRRRCRADWEAGELPVVASWRRAAAAAIPAPEDPPVEVRAPDPGSGDGLADLLAATLGLAPGAVESERPLTHYGLDSLKAQELAHRIEERLGVQVEVEELYQAASVAELAARLAGALPAAVPPPPEPGPAQADPPPSPGQQALWFLDRLEPGNPAYHLAAAVHLVGDLDAAALERALATLVERHGALRARLEAAGGEVRWRVAEALAPGWSSGWSGEEARKLAAEELAPEELARRLEEEAGRPFDLARGPLFRVRRFTTEGGGTVLLLAAHHAVADLWSLAVLARELGEAYRAAREGRPPALPALAADYSTYLRWQRELLASPGGQRLWDYWLERLTGELPVLDLPTDRPRPPVQTYRGGTVRLALPAAPGAALAALARRRGAPPSCALAAAFAVLLQRYGDQGEVLLGMPAAGRSRAAFAPLVGYFVNPVVLRLELAGEPAFVELLDAVRGELLGALAHQDLPFPLLVERLDPPRDPSRSPVFQAMFAWQSAPGPEGGALTAFALGVEGAGLPVADLVAEHLPLPQRIAQFDLTLSAGEVDGRLLACLDYNRDLFDPATAGRMARNLETLLLAVAAGPGRRLPDLPALAAAERHQVVAGFNDTAHPCPHRGTVVELIAARAGEDPRRPAVLAGEEELPFALLVERAAGLACRLAELGAGPEARVGLAAGRSPELLVGMLGILEAGAVCVPLEPDHPAERSAAVLRDAGAMAVVTTGAAAPAGLELPVVAVDAPAEAAPLPPPPPPAGLPAAAFLVYTSGSTGAPKGVVLEHSGLLNLVFSFHASYQAGPQDRMLPATAVASASFLGEVLPVLAAGGAVVLPTSEELLDPDRTWELVERRGVTILSSVPSLLAGLNARRRRPPGCLRLVLSGGEALGGGEVDRLLGAVTLVNGYGLTETTVCNTASAVAAGEAGGGAPAVGAPLVNQRVYVLDRRLEPLPLGAPGPIFVAGAGVARGYWRCPGATAGRFVPDPFAAGGRLFATGDLGRWRPGGGLELLGRADRQVKIRGVRVEPAEVVAALSRHPAVREAVVTVRPGGPGGRRLVAYVVGRGEGRPVPAGLLAELRGRLPAALVPAAVVVLDALPLSTNGKVDLAALPPPEEGSAALGAGYAAPTGEVERAVAGVWQEVLELPRVGVNDNFFDLGGHSLLVARVQERLRRVLAREIALVDLFQYPTVASLARFLAGSGAGEAAAGALARRVAARAARRRREETGGVAVVGMSGRFPGAAGVEELWENLLAGREAISFFDDDELLAGGIDPDLLADPDYVRARGVLGEVDRFDARFFGLNPRAAELMDPQHRVFLECAWEALERAGYDPERYGGRIGVFAGQSMNTYWLSNLYGHIDPVASVESLEAAIGNDKDSLTTEVSYRLNLTGPSVLVQSSSSTSLTAVHYACQSLLAGECDMALAGGVSIHLPEKAGYLYREGGTTSPDGHCRAFDAEARGFVSGHGAGVVVLKPLADALADGDTVHAVIRGSACNNDGAAKVSYMAPSVQGHAEAVAMALASAGLGAEAIGYLEAHGTGTRLGDPIEVAALTQAFRLSTGRTGFCALGSIKTNLGHLDTAAGVAGLVKAVLAVERGVIPPTLHFRRPNPEIDFAASPFFVNDRLRRWQPADGALRRAGVSSLGMGGTNTHVIVEQPPPAPAPEPSRPWQLLLLSAATAPALERSTANLAGHLRRQPHLEPADVAWTLAVGRKPFAHRRAVVGRDREELLAALESPGGEAVRTAHRPAGNRPVAFLFSGQGSQYPGMGAGLYRDQPVFRREVDRAAELLRARHGLDLPSVLDPEGDEAVAAERLRGTELAQPALFAVEHALAWMWMDWGLEPQAFLGHSVGEYVAACLEGVMSFEEALDLVAFRGRLMAALPGGSMLAVALPAAEVAGLLAGGLALAAVNEPGACVVSGGHREVADLRRTLTRRGVEARRLHTSHAFHSAAMGPVLEPFRQALARVTLSPPRRPFLSNLTGTWIRPEEATDPGYWVRHLRRTVRFADAVGELLADPERVLLEVGPGHTLAGAARKHPRWGAGHTALSSLRHPRRRVDDRAFALETWGRLWLAGVELDADRLWAGERRRRVALPTYPFERRRYWVEPLAAGDRRRSGPSPRVEDWFSTPVWKQAPLAVRPAAPAPAGDGPWLVFLDRRGLGAAVVRRLEAAGAQVVTVEAGEGFTRLGPRAFALHPGHDDGYRRLLAAAGPAPRRILHLWNVTGCNVTGEPPAPAEALELGVHSLLALGRALAAALTGGEVALLVAADHLFEVTGGEPLCPAKAALLGPLRALPREVPGLSCRAVDLAPAGGGEDGLAGELLAELALPLPPAAVAARRGGRRWLLTFDPVELAAGPPAPHPRLKAGGVYWVTGGLGGLGLEVARLFAGLPGARLVLTGRAPVPERQGWETYLARHPEDDPVSRKLRRLMALEAAGARLLTAAADVTDAAAMERVLAAARQRFGPVDGVVHAAGVAGGALAQLSDRREAERVLAPKVRGALVLDALFPEREPGFLVLFSSLTAVLAEPGQAAYAAANAFLDAFAHQRSRRGAFTVAVGWDAWQEVGMAVETEVPRELEPWRRESLRRGIPPAGGREALGRILDAELSQVTVSRVDLPARLEAWSRGEEAERLGRTEAGEAAHPRPELEVDYLAPADGLEARLAALWQEVLGIERVGAHDNFFDLGGNSLTGLKLVARLEGELGVKVPVVRLFESPTVHRLARALGAVSPEPGAPEAVAVAESRGAERGELRRQRRRRGARRHKELKGV